MFGHWDILHFHPPPKKQETIIFTCFFTAKKSSNQQMPSSSTEVPDLSKWQSSGTTISWRCSGTGRHEWWNGPSWSLEMGWAIWGSPCKWPKTNGVNWSCKYPTYSRGPKKKLPIWVFPKIGISQIIHFNRVFHCCHHPFWGPTPIFGNTSGA